MRRAALPLLAAVVAVAVIALLAFGLTQNGNGGLDSRVARGERPPAPTTTLPVLGAGAHRSLADFRGRVVVVNFFASWCVPCRTEMPMLVREQRRLVGRDATVVGLTYDDTTDDATAFARRYHVTYPILRDVDQSVAQDLHVRGVPETFVLDRKGRIVALRRGPVDRKFVVDAVRKAAA